VPRPSPEKTREKIFTKKYLLLGNKLTDTTSVFVHLRQKTTKLENCREALKVSDQSFSIHFCIFLLLLFIMS
jgi:hypothetical protein